MEYAWGSFTSTVSSTQTRLGEGGERQFRLLLSVSRERNHG